MQAVRRAFLALALLAAIILTTTSRTPLVAWNGGGGEEQPMGRASAGVQQIADQLNALYGLHVTPYVSRVPNAAAISGERVLYNPGFLNQIGDADSVFAVLAHEWAHEYLRHVDDARGSTWAKELAADFYSGTALRLTGRPLERYAQFLHDLAGRGSSTHPDGDRREAAVEKGYELAAGGPLAVGLPANGTGRTLSAAEDARITQAIATSINDGRSLSFPTPGVTAGVSAPEGVASTEAPYRQRGAAVAGNEASGTEADDQIDQQVAMEQGKPVFHLTNQSQRVVREMEVQVDSYSGSRLLGTKTVRVAFPNGWAPGQQTSVQPQVSQGADRLEFQVVHLSFGGSAQGQRTSQVPGPASELQNLQPQGEVGE